MRHSFALLVALCALLFTTASARAEDTPPPAPSGQQPAPPPDKSSDHGPKVTARKEEEDEAAKLAAANAKAREGFFAGLFGAGKKAVQNDLAAALAENEKLTARLADLEKQNAALQKQLAYIDANWPAIEAALTQGNAEDPALKTDLGKKVADLTMKTAAAQVHNATGHDPKKLPGPKADKPDTGKPLAESDGKPLDRRQQAAANAEYWAARGAPWATAGNN